MREVAATAAERRLTSGSTRERLPADDKRSNLRGRSEATKTPGQPLNVRRGVVFGLVVLAVLAPGIAMRSDAPFLTLVETLVIGMAAVFGAVAVVEAINRWRARPPSRGPALHTRRAAALGLGVGLLTGAAVSAQTADPLATFVSNVVRPVGGALRGGSRPLR